MYAITSVTSVLAYLWLLVILIFSSPDIVELWEALLTFAFFWILLLYVAPSNRGHGAGAPGQAGRGR